MSPRAPKDRPPKWCDNYAICGNDVVVRQATWCPECRSERAKDQRKVSNARAYRAVRSPGSIVLSADQARTLREDLGLLVTVWNAFAEAGPGVEPSAERDRLFDVLEGALIELWEALPEALLWPDAAEP